MTMGSVTLTLVSPLKGEENEVGFVDTHEHSSWYFITQASLVVVSFTHVLGTWHSALLVSLKIKRY